MKKRVKDSRFLGVLEVLKCMVKQIYPLKLVKLKES